LDVIIAYAIAALALLALFLVLFFAFCRQVPFVTVPRTVPLASQWQL